MGSQKFCLRWNNYQSNMMDMFEYLHTTEEFVDVTLACEGRSIKAHKVVLSACSPFFQDILAKNPCKHPVIILQDVLYSELLTIIEFMYKGQVDVSQNDLPSLLMTAELLRVKGLAEIDRPEKQSTRSPTKKVNSIPMFVKNESSSSFDYETQPNFARYTNGNKNTVSPPPKRTKRHQADVAKQHYNAKSLSVTQLPSASHINEYDDDDPCSRGSEFLDETKPLVPDIKRPHSPQEESISSDYNVELSMLMEQNMTPDDVAQEDNQIDENVYSPLQNPSAEQRAGSSSQSAILPFGLSMVEDETSCISSSNQDRSIDRMEEITPSVEKSDESPDPGSNTDAAKKLHQRQECPYCHKMVVKLKRHLEIHRTYRERYHCEYCGCGYSYHFDLLAHIRRNHPEARFMAGANVVTEDSDKEQCRF